MKSRTRARSQLSAFRAPRLLRNHSSSEISARVDALREQAEDYRRYIAQLDGLLPDQAIKLVHARALLGRVSYMRSQVRIAAIMAPAR